MPRLHFFMGSRTGDGRTVLDVSEQLLERLLAAGYPARLVAVRHVQDLLDEFKGRYDRGEFDDEFYREDLQQFDFSPEAKLPGAQSLLVVAQPAWPMRLVVHHQGRTVPAVLPPTYAYSVSAQQCNEALGGVLGPAGYHTAWARLPVKSLAVHSGLARYGRNNVTYVPGMGSFARLTAFYADLPCAEDEWQELQMMERCVKCTLCRRICPTGAIGSDRFLLHGERCITYHNERAPQSAFPGWLDPAWHNAIIGCMLCQRACPEDKTYLDLVGGEVELADEETALLLRGATKEELAAETAAKLARLDLLDKLDILPRNLGALLMPGSKRDADERG
jgi:epoxyqueuosine reductase